MNFCDLQRFRRKTPVAAEVHADRFTVAKKNGTSAETYGEPQTPVNRFAVALSSELPEFSTAVVAAKRVIPHSGASSCVRWTPACRWSEKGGSTPCLMRAQLFRIPRAP